jgi:hypothetical protein
MKFLHAASGLLEMGAGAALLSVPSLTAKLLIGAPLQDAAPLTVARVAGGGLLALGLSCWLARNDTESGAGRGLVRALLVYNVVVTAVLAFAGTSLGLHGVALWPAVILHVGMAGWCVAALVR